MDSSASPNLIEVDNFSFSLNKIFPAASCKIKRMISSANMQKAVVDTEGYRSVVYFVNWVRTVSIVIALFLYYASCFQSSGMGK
jgi:hypothetical protein